MVKALKEAWSSRHGGFLCHYTGVKLDENDSHSPWYLTFDHRTPHTKGDLVVAAFAINVMKSELSEDEFVKFIKHAAEHFAGKPFNREIIPFDSWTRNPGPKPKPLKAGKDHGKGGYSRECVVCGGVALLHSMCCARCRGFALTNKYKEIKARRVALKLAWSKKDNGFLCYYSGMVLEEKETRSPWYLTFDHRVPKDKATIVVSSFIFNVMKTDTTEVEFKAFVKELARHWNRSLPFRKKMVEFTLWHRVIRPKKRK